MDKIIDKSIDELIEIIFKKNEKKLNDLSSRQLIQLHRHFNIETKGKTKYLLIKQLASIENRYKRIREIESAEYSEECPICYENIQKNQYVITNCLHIFCETCIIQHLIKCNNETCPYCRQECKLDDIIIFPISDKLLKDLGIMKITQSVIDTGLFFIESIKSKNYITDSTVIQIIQDYQSRQMYKNKLLLIIKYCLVLYFISIIIL